MTRAISWQVDEPTMGVVALTVGSVASMLAAFNPSVYTIQTSGGNAVEARNTRRSIHIGCALGAAISLALGYGATLVTRSWWPLFTTVLALIVVCGAYEWALRHPYSTRSGMKEQ